MHWVLLLALSNGGVAVVDAENLQHCEEIRVNYQENNTISTGFPQLNAAKPGIEWAVCTVRES